MAARDDEAGKTTQGATTEGGPMSKRSFQPGSEPLDCSFSGEFEIRPDVPMDHPQREIQRAAEYVYFGKAHGDDGYSCFAGVIMLGAFHAVEPGSAEPVIATTAYATIDKDHPEAALHLARRMRDIADQLEASAGGARG